MVHKTLQRQIKIEQYEANNKLKVNSPDCAYNKQSISVDICDIYLPFPSTK